MRRIVADRRLVVLGLFIALAVGCASHDGADSSRTAEESARELARLSIELGSLDAALGRAADWTWSASVDAFTLELGREPSEEENDRGRAILREVLGEFLTPELWGESIALVYTERFTAAELNEMVRFYGSPVGRKVLSLEGEVTDAVDDEIGAALGEGRLEEFIARVDEALGAEFGLDGGQGS
jgi:hypothetical protein